MQTRNDRAIVLIGILSTIPYEIFTRVLVALGVGKYSVYQLSSLVVTLNRPTAILGALTTLIVSCVIAMIFYHILKKLGSEYVVIKGAVTGLFSWLVTEVIYTWLIEGPGHAFRPVSDYYLEAAGSTVFGIVLLNVSMVNYSSLSKE